MPEQVLRDAENSSIDRNPDRQSDGAVDEARSAEGEEHFRNSVSGKDSENEKGKKRKSKVGLKKKGPIIALLALLAVAVVAVLVVQGIMPFAVVNRLIEEYNTNGISSLLRADNILDVQLSSQPHSTFALGDHQISALKENNILPLEYGGGTLLAYKKSEGKWNVAKGTSPENPSVTDIQARLKAEYSGYTFENVSLISLKDAFEDGDFKVPYTTASKTWRGGNSGWYDELALIGGNIHGYQRSRWFKRGSKKFFKEIARSSLSSYKGDVSTTGGDRSIERETTHTNETTGESVTETTLEPDGEVDTSDGSLVGQSRERAAFQLAAKFISMATGGVDLVCAGVEGLMGVQTVVSTYQRIQKLNLVSGFMEAVQSVQAGDTSNDGTPMHEYSNRLVETNPETGKSAMNSAGVGALFSGEPINSSDASVASINSEKALSNAANDTDNDIMKVFGSIVGNANAMLEAFKVCGYLQGGLAIANAVITIIPIIGQGIAAISLAAKTVIKAGIKALIAAAAPVIARKVIEYAGNLLIQDIATEWLGEDLGNALVSGGNSLLSANHQTGGGSPGSSAKVSAFRKEQATAIAEEAEYQRAIRSPFDITSGHTFLGSIVYNLIPLATSSGVGSIVKSISSVMTNSVSKLLPTASAIAETGLIDDFAKPGDCPSLEVVGIQGDAYCNPIYITDEATIGNDNTNQIEDVIEQEESWGYITRDNGNITIKPNTHLTNYIVYCGQRTSSFGLADANIAKAISSGGSSVVKNILSFVPVVGDALTVADSANKLENLPWTTGSACVASESNEYWCENQIHQRFIEDQRLYADINGQTKDNPVAAYLNSYYEEHPLDNSYEGILARYSGMTKDDVIATLELMEGLNYLANYHPEERYAFGHEEPETNLQFEQTEEVLIAIEPKYIVYNTLRNRAVLV